MKLSGYEAVKVKVGERSVEEDVELTRAVYEGLGDAVVLRLAAYRAWTRGRAASAEPRRMK